MKKLTLSVAALTIAMMGINYKLTAQTQCEGLTKDSVQCKNITKTKVELCYLHNPNYVKSNKVVSVICNRTTKKNILCKNKTKNTNGKCHLHGGKKD